MSDRAFIIPILESRIFVGDAGLIAKRLDNALQSDKPEHGATHWCEKTPRNIKNVVKIFNYFGDAIRFLHIVRDGRDVVSSIHPSAPERYWVSPRRWINDLMGSLTYENDARFLVVRCEDLLKQSQLTVKKIFRFVEVCDDENYPNYPVAARVKNNYAWFGDKAKPLYEDSVGRWRDPRHESIVNKLLNKEGTTDLLKHYGYL